MRIPRRVEIIGRKYVVRRLAPARMKHEGEPAFGLCDPAKCEILIDKTLSPEAARGVFLHELTHAVLYETGIHRKLEELDAEHLEEDICDAVPVLVAALQRGKKR